MPRSSPTVAPAFVFGLDQVDTLVTDTRADPGDVVALEARGIRVVVTVIRVAPGPR